MNSKKGVSIMIGYVLLISMALILGFLVYNWAQSLLPQEDLQCPDGVSLLVKQVDCKGGDELKITVANNGVRTIDGYYLRARVDEKGDLATLNLNPPDTGYVTDAPLTPTDEGNVVEYTVPIDYSGVLSTGATKDIEYTCIGSEIDCTSISDLSECQNLEDLNTGCYLNSANTCLGTGGCEVIEDDTACNALSACEWDRIDRYEIFELELIPVKEVANSDGIITATSCSNAIVYHQPKHCYLYAP